MCEDCREVFDHYHEALQPVIDKALRIFWETVSKAAMVNGVTLPKYVTLDADAVRTFATQALAKWAFEEYGFCTAINNKKARTDTRRAHKSLDRKRQQ